MTSTKTNMLDMTQGPVLGPLLKFSLPIMLTGILQLLFNAADIIVVGQFVNEKAVAAVGACSSLIQLTINLFIGLSLGATVTIANDLGARRHEELPPAVHTTYALGILFGLLVGAVGMVYAKTFLRWMDTPDDILDQAALYLRIYFVGMPAFMIYTFGRAIIVPTGDTKKPLYYLTISGVLNVFLNVFLVVVFRLGVAGVAIATAISQVLSAVLMTAALLRLEGPCRLTASKIGFNGRQLRRIVALGLPAGLQGTVFSISNVVIQSSVNILGTLFVAGNSAAANLSNFVYTSMNAISQGCMTFGGQNYGADQHARLDRIYKAGLFSVTLIGLVLGFGAWLAGVPLLRIYLPTSAQAVDYGMVRMSIEMTTIALCGLMDCSTGMLRGINRSVYPMAATVVGSCVLRVVWAFTVFRRALTGGKATTAYLVLLASYPISWALTFAALLVYYIAVRKKMDRQPA